MERSKAEMESLAAQLTLELKVLTQEMIIEFIINNNQGKIAVPSQVQINRFIQKTLSGIRERYPDVKFME